MSGGKDGKGKEGRFESNGMEFRRYITNWKAPNMDVVRGFGLMVTWVDFGTFAGLVGLWGGTGGGGIFEDGVAIEGSSQGNSG